MPMSSRVSSSLYLEYPNGRTHQVQVDEELVSGQEFDLYGHRWKVIGSVRVPRGTRQPWLAEAAGRPLLCRQQP